MIEPLSVVFHGFAKIKGAGTSLLITGSGFLSYASLCVAKYLNFKNVRILSTSKSNSDIYEGFSFVEEIDSDLDFDCCIDFSGNFNLLNLATTLLLPKSTIVSLANSREDTFLDVEARNQIIRKELRYLGSWNSTFSKQMDDWQEAITFIASRPTFAYPVKEIMLEDLPNYLNSISPNFPRERIHVRF
jgi:L-iditol 2-dehydrogenase